MVASLPFHKRILLERLYHVRTYGLPVRVKRTRTKLTYYCVQCGQRYDLKPAVGGRQWMLPNTRWRGWDCAACVHCCVCRPEVTHAPENYVMMRYDH